MSGYLGGSSEGGNSGAGFGSIVDKIGGPVKQPEIRVQCPGHWQCPGH
jgi:hypothetical protein